MDSDSETLQKRVASVLDMAVSTVGSLSESFVSGLPVEEEAAAVEKGVAFKDLAISDDSGEKTVSSDGGHGDHGIDDAVDADDAVDVGDTVDASDAAADAVPDATAKPSTPHGGSDSEDENLELQVHD